MRTVLRCPVCDSHIHGFEALTVVASEAETARDRAALGPTDGDPKTNHERLGDRLQRRLATVLICLTCTAVTEVDSTTGELRDYPGYVVSNLTRPENAADRPVTARSLARGNLRWGES